MMKNNNFRTIIHIDMDAFFAAVEVRDDPELKGKPLIIGALPHERGVVATCSYEARVYGVRSAMSIKEAYRRCPHGVYMHPNGWKYSKVSDEIRKIWLSYTDIAELVSLDEGFLDVTGAKHHFGAITCTCKNPCKCKGTCVCETTCLCTARKIATEIKERTKEEIGLTCSVGIGYSMMSAKLASEEKKPNGLFEIPNAETLTNLIIDRSVRIIYGIGPKTEQALQLKGIKTVRDMLENKHSVIEALGNGGQHYIDLAEGIDDRRVTPYYEGEAKSVSRETTFQEDIKDFDYLKDALRLLAKELSLNIRFDGTAARTVTLKVKYSNMKLITRSKSGDSVNKANDIYKIAASMLDTVDKRPIRLIGISLSGFGESEFKQISMDESGNLRNSQKDETLDRTLLELQKRFGGDIIKSGNEIIAEKRFNHDS